MASVSDPNLPHDLGVLAHGWSELLSLTPSHEVEHSDSFMSVFDRKGTCSGTDGSPLAVDVRTVSSNSCQVSRVWSGAGLIEADAQAGHFPTIALMWMLRGEARIGVLHRQSSIVPGSVAIFRSWERINLALTENIDAIIVRIPLPWFLERARGTGAIGWIGSDEIAASADFPFRDVITAALATFLRSMKTSRSAAPAEDLLRVTINTSLDALSNVASGEIVTQSNRMGRIYLKIASHHANEMLTPKQVAASLRISTRTLHKTCADHGTTFSKIVRSVRLQEASYMLKTGDDRISDVAYSVGYASLPHFCRQFKEAFGISAKAYRASF